MREKTLNISLSIQAWFFCVRASRPSASSSCRAESKQQGEWHHFSCNQGPANEHIRVICGAIARWCALCEVLGATHACVVQDVPFGALVLPADTRWLCLRCHADDRRLLVVLTVDGLTHANRVVRSSFSDNAHYDTYRRDLEYRLDRRRAK